MQKLKKTFAMLIATFFLSGFGSRNLDIDTKPRPLCVRSERKAATVCTCRLMKLSNIDGNAGMVFVGSEYRVPVKDCNDIIGWFPHVFAKIRPEYEEFIEAAADERDN